jgi:hypothetical protein
MIFRHVIFQPKMVEQRLGPNLLTHHNGKRPSFDGHEKHLMKRRPAIGEGHSVDRLRIAQARFFSGVFQQHHLLLTHAKCNDFFISRQTQNHRRVVMILKQLLFIQLLP